MIVTIMIAFFCAGVAAFDIKFYRIPNFLLALFVAVVLITKEGRLYATAPERLAASLYALIIFLAVWYFTKGIGMGDVKYAAVLGFLLGAGRAAHSFWYTGIICIIVYSIGLFLFNWSKNTKIPFAPFLSAGVIMSLLVSP